jgi:hypothetical protein
MLAYPTPTFNAKTILQAPGNRPIGKSGGLVYQEQPEAVTAPSLVNRHTANGGFVGSRSKQFIQNNQFNTSSLRFDPTKGSPLSQPGSVGNVDTQAIGCQPKYAEPENGELKAILNILNGKPQVGEVERLSAKQLASLERKAKPENVEGAKRVVEDFSDAREATRKVAMINKAIRQGFSKDEAEEAYRKMRVREAEATLFKEDDPSVRLYDLIDSRVGGTQDGSIRSNDETGLFLAKGENAIMVKQAQKRNVNMDRATQPSPSLINISDLTLRLSAKNVAAFQSREIPRGLGGLGEPKKPLLMIEDKKPTLSITELGERVLTTAAGIEKIPKKKGRPAGAADTKPRVRPSGLKYKIVGRN